MYKKNLALNDLQWLLCHKTKPKQNQSGPLTQDQRGSEGNCSEEMVQTLQNIRFEDVSPTGVQHRT